MQAMKPFFYMDEDSKDRIIVRSGQIVGFSRTRVIWQFGFLHDSDMSKAFGVETESFTWIIADYNGNILDTYKGYAFDLPLRYRNLIASKL